MQFFHHFAGASIGEFAVITGRPAASVLMMILSNKALQP